MCQPANVPVNPISTKAGSFDAWSDGTGAVDTEPADSGLANIMIIAGYARH
jgi:hypothetical protein